jgi:hypothetical protein
MWKMHQIEGAFSFFKLVAPDPRKLDVWWNNDGLCVFGSLSEEDILAHPPGDFAAFGIPERLEHLKKMGWHYETSAERFGDVCWYLFRSD